MAVTKLGKARTVLALGLPNVLRALVYRLGVRLGIHPVIRLRARVPTGPFFIAAQADPSPWPATTAWRTQGMLFSRWPVVCAEAPPDWLANPLSGERLPAPERPWWRIPDFDPRVGDIKLLWELSRFDWVLAFAQRARQGDAAELARLNRWLQDWCRANPPYLGPNWKCGQEASLRVLHLACAAVLLEMPVAQALPGLRELLVVHLQRIAPTRQYAIAQDNNHGTSEAAALFVGGTWLAHMGDARGHGWARSGRALLRNRAERLIGANGTFSQYSLNYHRMMLDTLSFAELWRRRVDAPAFDRRFLARAQAATRWLYEIVDPVSGDGPNVGANDGARLFQLADMPYRDYRFSVQWAMAMFANERAYAQQGPWDTACGWLGVDQELPQAPGQQGLWADDGGFAMLRRKGAMALLRYPRFRFRPSQADALHVDLWVDGSNLLRDAGTYSYNTDAGVIAYFGGTAGHNTVQFDGRDQMPRLGRFLFGAWLRPQDITYTGGDDLTDPSAQAAYRDHAGAYHLRQVSLRASALLVEDRIDGCMQGAVLRWRLEPGNWQLQEGGQGPLNFLLLNDAGHRLTVTSSVPARRGALVSGEESRHYYERTAIPVFELEVDRPAVLTTLYAWKT